jgi:Flp pilus assembly secretin CpaC
MRSYSPVTVRIDPSQAARLADLAGERPLVIDHYASRRCGVTIGDLRARFETPPHGADVVELDAIGSVRILAEPALLELLGSGASLRLGGSFSIAKVGVELDHPELWLEFLEAHPERRR